LFFKRAISILCGFSLFAGCATAGKSHVDTAAKKMNARAADERVYFDVDNAAGDQRKEQEAQGSLWVNTYSARLYENMYRASRPGDTVTIVVSESSQALGSGATKSNRKTDHSASIDDLGGILQKMTTLISAFNPASLIKAKTESKFQGDGATERKGQLNARMTAQIVNVLRNGNMVVRGEQHIKVNKEEQVLIVEGLIRPYDILPDNTVLSSSLADARITYTGFGVVANRQSPGWLVQVLDKVWPF
jgi:flagellar L-ring protein precursor FlgH